MSTRRLKLTIAYRGTRYHGWQRQPVNPTWKGPTSAPGLGIATIEQSLVLAIESVLKHPVTLRGSSRTDSGVHAKGQVAHLETDQQSIPVEGFRLAVNSRLAGDIVVRKVEQVDATFDAIRSTRSKRYQYAIWNQPDRPVFYGDLCWHEWRPLDVSAMDAAARALEGEHDFTSFARPGHRRASAVRTIHECRVSRRGPLVVVGVEGSGFLWNMVRIIVSTLVEVGLGRRDAGSMGAVLAARDRRAAGGTAPPAGLYLHWIRFHDRPAATGDNAVEDEAEGSVLEPEE